MRTPDRSSEGWHCPVCGALVGDRDEDWILAKYHCPPDANDPGWRALARGILADAYGEYISEGGDE